VRRRSLATPGFTLARSMYNSPRSQVLTGTSLLHRALKETSEVTTSTLKFLRAKCENGAARNI
jgi:hypothetical protein